MELDMDSKVEKKKSEPDRLQRMSQVETISEEARVPTGITGLDQCLSAADDEPGGIPPGTSILLSGMPGGGKSTMANMILAAETSGEALYLHGEERARSVKKRHDRLRLLASVDLFLCPLRGVEKALDVIRDINVEGQLRRVAIDSVQTLTLNGKRRYDDQFEAVEMIVGQVCSGAGIGVFVSHVSKTGADHAGAAALAHLVDIHLHVTTSARRAERMLEIRKNRHGRAGFQVPINIGANSLSVGVPAPLDPSNGSGGMGRANSSLERCRDRAIELLMTGEPLNFYDFDKAGVNGNLWRAGLEMAAKSLARSEHDSDGNVIKPGLNVKSAKRNSRMTFWIEGLPKAEKKIIQVPAKIEVVDSLELDMT